MKKIKELYDEIFTPIHATYDWSLDQEWWDDWDDDWDLDYQDYEEETIV